MCLQLQLSDCVLGPPKWVVTLSQMDHVIPGEKRKNKELGLSPYSAHNGKNKVFCSVMLYLETTKDKK